MEMVRDWVVNIITVIMISLIAEIMMPDGKFKKYCNLVMGLIIMVMIIKPVIHLANADDLLERMTLQTGYSLDRSSLEQQSEAIAKKQQQQIIDNYKSKLAQQIRLRVEARNKECQVRVMVEVEDNKEQKQYGNIKNIRLTLTKAGKKTTAVTPVEPVKVDGGKTAAVSSTSSQKVEPDKADLQIIDRVKNDLEATYNINQENISVEVQKNNS